MKTSSSLRGPLASSACSSLSSADASFYLPLFPVTSASAYLSCYSMCLHAISVKPHLQAQIQIIFCCLWWFTDLLPRSIYPSGGLSFWHHPKDMYSPAVAQHGGSRAAQLTAWEVLRGLRSMLPVPHASLETSSSQTSSHILSDLIFFWIPSLCCNLSSPFPVHASGISSFSYSHLFFLSGPIKHILIQLVPSLKTAMSIFSSWVALALLLLPLPPIPWFAVRSRDPFPLLANPPSASLTNQS